MKDIIIFGGGNHARYCIDIIERENKYNIIGIVDTTHSIGTGIHGYQVISNSIKDLKTKRLKTGIITVGDNYSRYQIHKEITSIYPDFCFVNAIDPSVVISKHTNLGKGIVAMPGVIINVGAKVGNFTFLATGAQIEHDCEIADYASVSAGTIMGGHVRVGRWSALTLGVTVADRLDIGENSVVGAGSIVMKSIPDNVLAYGNPAKIVRSRKLGEKFLK